MSFLFIVKKHSSVATAVPKSEMKNQQVVFFDVKNGNLQF